MSTVIGHMVAGYGFAPLGTDLDPLLEALATVVGLSVILLTRRLPRWAGAVLVAAYLGFAAGGYLLVGGTPGAGG